MKTCPKCSKVYDDPGLNFCLDDGEWLLPDDIDKEDATKVFPSSPDSSEAPTKQKITRTDETAVLHTNALERAISDSGNKRRRRVFLGAAVGLLVFLGAGYGLFRWYSGSASSPGSVPEIEAERLTGDGKVHEAAISPDGKFLAYLEVRDDKSTLRVKQIETNSTVEILKAGDFEVINNVVFSPDGNFVFFGAIALDRKMSVYKVPTLGGTAVAIPVASMSFSLSPDGSMLAYYGEDAESTETHIGIAGTDGSNSQKIVSKTGKKWVEAGTAWSQDGSSLVLVEGDDDRLPEPELSLAVYSLSERSTKTLGSSRWERVDNKGLVWDPSGRFVYITGEQAGGNTMQLWRVSLPDGETVKLTQNQRDYRGLSVTSDGSRLVTTEEEFRTSVWVSQDLDPMNAVEVIPGRGDTFGLDWTPDGRIVYVSDQSGASEVWIMKADGTEQKQLTNDRLLKIEPSVSPDGRSVVYTSTVEGFQIYAVPIGGGDPERIDTGQVGPDNPKFSSDGKFIAFSAWTGGKQSIYRIPAPKGNSERLTNFPSTEPAYSPDGSMIACFSILEGEKFWILAILPAEGGSPVKTFQIPTSTATSRGPAWTPDGKQITYIVSNGEKSDLWAQPVEGGDPVRISDFTRPWIARRSYSQDGKRIAITRGEAFRDAVMLTVMK